jgi:hypothetical protein
MYLRPISFGFSAWTMNKKKDPTYLLSLKLAPSPPPVSDPDLDWIKNEMGSVDLDQGKQNPKKVKKFHVLLCWMFYLEGLRFLL